MSTIYNFANEYINFHVGEKTLRVPYAIASYAIGKYGIGENVITPTTGKFENYAGKGAPQQIKNAVNLAVKKNKFNLSNANSQQIYSFMESHGIGIDCSGFVYNVLDAYLRKEKNMTLDNIVLRYSGLLGRIERFILRKNRVRKCNADTLTNNLNTIKVEKVKDMQPGDMIRLTHSDWKGKHIAIIVDISSQYIVYAMTSEYTQIRGSHFGKIKILNPQRGLESQKWEELTKNGKNYGKDAFDPKRGDSVRRLKVLINH